MPSSLLELPVELLERIIDFIDYPKELLSLALSCKNLCYLVIPRPLEYRFIETRADNFVLWQSLISNPSIAINVRILHISARIRRGYQKPHSNVTKSVAFLPGPSASPLSAGLSNISNQNYQDEVIKIITNALNKLYYLTTLIWEWESFTNFGETWTLYPLFSAHLPNLRNISVHGSSPPYTVRASGTPRPAPYLSVRK
jgi:hypothetical protein